MTEGGKSVDMSTSFESCFNTVLHARAISSLKRGASSFRFATQFLVRECQRSVIFGRTKGSRCIYGPVGTNGTTANKSISLLHLQKDSITDMSRYIPDSNTDSI